MTSMAASADDKAPQAVDVQVQLAKPTVSLIAWTTTDSHKLQELTDFVTDTGGGQALAEFAGRACYQSFHKPNPATASNEDYLEHILEVGHESVLEHGTATFYFTGVSRSLTHELIRHRHFSYSQLSQRYVPEDNAAFVEPLAIASDPVLHAKWIKGMHAALELYSELAEALMVRFEHMPNKTDRLKKAREQARSVLPNATETRIVVTGNYRAWRHFLLMRATRHADVEIRNVTIQLFKILQPLAPHVFQDMIVTLDPFYGYEIVRAA